MNDPGEDTLNRIPTFRHPLQVQTKVKIDSQLGIFKIKIVRPYGSYQHLVIIIAFR